MNAARRSRRARSRPARRRILPLMLAAVALLAIIAIVLVVLWVQGLRGGAPQPPGTSTTPSTPSTRPEAQSADCPDVLTLVVPGTWESAADDDPDNPTANPRSLMLRVSSALKEQFPESRTEVYTVPYVAQFRNPTNLNDHQADYNDSRTQGYKRAAGKIISTHERCPLTRYVIMGFSQGAVISGDLASAIGNGRGGVLPAEDADLVLGVGLIADGRRQPGDQRDITPSPPGVGAEISLSGMGTLVPGITMTGPRTGGFGSVRDKVVSICAPGDLICDAPTVTNPLGAVNQLLGALNNPVHALYATPRYWSHDGATATQWMLGWSQNLIDAAPRPAHN
ncbi:MULTISPECIES: cutinase family protein [Gordonia]|uniref:cutinase family protein n=2 Tax=Gordonia TaxID=2053 RepID=UPI003CCE14FA